MTNLGDVSVGPAEITALALTNYGHFTSMRVDNGRVRGLSLHMDRLVNDARALFGAELDQDQIRQSVRTDIGDRRGSFVVRLTVFDPDLPLAHPAASGSPKILITTREATNLPAPPLKIESVTYQRDMPEVKHIGLFGALLGRRNAQLRGYDDALFVDAQGFISEGATWNVGFCSGHHVVWPDAAVLPGVTMRLLQAAYAETAIRPVNLHELGDMQIAFATNTSIGVRPISSINGQSFNPEHNLISTLRKEYEEISPELI